MSEKKTIQINPELFKMSKQTRKKRETQEKTPAPLKVRVKEHAQHKQAKTTKNQILKYFRQQQQQKYDEMLKHGAKKHDADHVRTDLIDDFETDFKQSLDYLNAMAEKKETTVPKTWNTTLKNTNSVLLSQPSALQYALQHPSITDENVATIVPDVFSQPQRVALPPPPQYGCLKGGTLPTYRMWNTAKNMASVAQPQPSVQPLNVAPQSISVPPNILVPPSISVPPPNILVPNAAPQSISAPPLNVAPQSISVPPPNMLVPSVTEKTLLQRLQNPAWLEPTKTVKAGGLRTKHAIEQKMKELEARTPWKPKRHQRKTMRRTFLLGKSKHYPKIGVLVSNKTLRKQIGTRTQQLKQTPIDEVRKALIKKGLIKVGSIAPNDVLRKMYETMNMMCGDLHNHNPDNLIYNYLNGM